MSGRPGDELCAGYEALRAAATGAVICETPRGLSLLVAQGLPGWIRAWAPLPPPAPVPADDRPVAGTLGGEMVRVLTEMALGCRGGLAVS